MAGTPQPTRIVATRVQPPNLGERLVARDRLIEVLRTGRSKRLTLIHAPAGYGKTTLAMQWRAELLGTGVVVAWLSLDRDDDDVVTFLAHLLEAIRRVEPTLGADLADQLEERSGDASRYVLAELVNQVGASARPLAIVLDDWHLVAHPDTTAALDFLLKMGPDNLHLVVTSRTRNPAIGWLRVRDQVTEVGAGQLRFDHAESATFLRDLNALPLASGEVASLWSSTDGWVAALQLVTLSLRHSNDPSGLIAGFSGRHRSVGDYLAENVLDGLPSELLDFLLTTSVCDRLCAGLATAVSGQRQGQAVLEELERRDLFLRPLDDDREWFSYHHLFADYLRQRLERDHGDRVADLHRTAGAWFAEHGLIGEAVTHGLRAGDDRAAVDLVEHHAMNLVEHSRMASLLGLVSKLPAGEVTSRPHLQMAVAWANCLLQRAAEAQTALDHVRTALAGDEPSAAMLTEADVVQACIDVYGDRIDRAAELVAPCLADTVTHRPFLVAVSANIQTFVNIHSGELDAAQERQRWANPFHQTAGGPFVGVYGRCFAGLAAFARLDLATAERRYTEARDLADAAAGPHSHAARLTGALLGRLVYERDDIDTAETLLEQCHELGSESGVVDFMIATYSTLPRIKVLRGDVDGALALLDEGEDAARRLALPRLAAAVDYQRVRVHLAADDVAAAEEVLAGHRGDTRSLTGGIATGARHFQLGMEARILSAHNEFGLARERLWKLREDSIAAGWRFAELAYTVELARTLYLDDDAERATDLLVPALATGARAGLLRTFVDTGPQVMKLIAALRESNRAGYRRTGLPLVPNDYLSRLLTVARADAGKTAIAGHSPTAGSTDTRLTVREVEILRLLERGMSNKQIARAVGVTINTVKWHLKSTYTKLGVTSRGESVSEARRRHILS